MQTTAPTTSFYFGRRSGAPFSAGPVAGQEVELTPESLVLLLHWRHFGYVWNWPIGLIISRNGRIERKAVVDVTRLALWSLILAAVVMALGFFFLPHKR